MQILPVDKKIPEVIDALETCTNLLFRSTPGSGKTTRIPATLLNAPYHKNSGRTKILVLEPRRVAAKFAAIRVAYELNTEVGERVGYRFRFESRVSNKSELIFITEGLLLRMLEGDPGLKDVSTVILDEFHERHLTTDLAIALLKRLQSGSRPDLRIVILSATIDPKPIVNYLHPCSFIDLETNLNEIEIKYLDSKANTRIEDEVLRAVRVSFDDNIHTKYNGDILVFLPGMREIRACENRLSQYFSGNRDIVVLPLHGELDRREQDAAILPIKGKRKIILSTNVAESSLTIEGLSIVIDSGLERQAITNPWSGLTSLHTKTISKASIRQRSGRAGRTMPGLSLRLYSKQDFDSRPEHTRPEIKRIDLSETLLDLMNLGVEDISTFPFYEAPEMPAIQAALELLFRLDAIESASFLTKITPVGMQMAEFSLHPRISRSLLLAISNESKLSCALLSALLNEDELTLYAYLDAQKGKMGFPVKKLFERILSLLKIRNDGKYSDVDSLSAIFIHGFPDRVGRIRSKEQRNELTISHGGMVRSNETTPMHDYYLVLSQRNGVANFILPLDEEHLYTITHDGIRTIDHAFYDKQRDMVKLSVQIRYGSLVIEESQHSKTQSKDSSALIQVLFKDVLEIKLDEVQKNSLQDSVHRISTKLGREDIEPWFARLKLIGCNDQELKELLQKLFSGMLSLKECRTFEIDPRFSELLDSDKFSKVESECPKFFRLPGRKQTPIQYSLSQEPLLESRIQDFFGLKQTPTILSNKHQLKISLLAPNKRPVQVTNDLKGFFERTYPKVRLELMRQYPKHAWPERP